MTLNLTELDGRPTTLLLKWEKPLWDIRNITRAVGINCYGKDASQGVAVMEIRNISDYEITLPGLNFSKCCLVALTTEGNGYSTCEDYLSMIAGLQSLHVITHARAADNLLTKAAIIVIANELSKWHHNDCTCMIRLQQSQIASLQT